MSPTTDIEEVDLVFEPTKVHSETCEAYTEAKIGAEKLTKRLMARAGTAVSHPKIVIAEELGRASSAVRNG